MNIEPNLLQEDGAEVKRPLNLEPEPFKDIRIQGTELIWKWGTGLFAVACFLGKAPQESIQELMTLTLGAMVVSTAAVWGFSTLSELRKSKALSTSEVKMLDERLTNLETIISYEDQKLHDKLERLRSETQSG